MNKRRLKLEADLAARSSRNDAQEPVWAMSQRQDEAIVKLANCYSMTGPHDLASDQQLLVRAADLARRRHYDDAMAMLATLPSDSPLRPSILDLKAKIFAQQGRYWEAETCWHQALNLSPDNQAFRLALAAIAEKRQRPFSSHLAVTIVVAALTSAVVVLVLATILYQLGWAER